MAGIVERLGSMASTDMGKVLSLAHTTYNERMQVHNHTGLAILETIGHVARVHPAIFGVGALFLIELVLEEQKILHQQHLAASGAAAGSATGSTAGAEPHAGGGLHFPHIEAPHLTAPQLHAPKLNLDHIKPGKVAMEVFMAMSVNSGFAFLPPPKSHPINASHIWERLLCARLRGRNHDCSRD